MTDEERQKLCATLRRMPGMLRHDCSRAADEIERLEAEREAAQSTLLAVRARLEFRVSELERKSPW